MRLILNLAVELGAGMLVVDVVTTEIGRPLQQYDGAVVDVNFAPELDRFLPAGSELHERAMSGFLQWLYPQAGAMHLQATQYFVISYN